MTQTPTLGLQMKVSGLAVHGRISELIAQQILSDVIDLIGMSTANLPVKVWSYPLHTGQGGQGHTLLKPFLVGQPLVESIALSANIIDTWDHHQGFYLIVCSCKSYEMGDIIDYLDELGLQVNSLGSFTLKLQPEQEK